MSCACVSTTDAMMYSTLLPYVLPYVVGCPDELAEFHIKQSAVELAKTSGALVYKQSYDLWKSVEQYSINIPEGYEFGWVSSLVYGRAAVGNPFAASWSCSCAGNTFVVDPPKCITISPAPSRDIAAGMELTITVYPSQNSPTVDRDFLERYGESIAYGALTRLFLIPKEEWTSPRDSAIYARKYSAGKSQARIDRAMNYTEGAITMRAPRWL